MNGKQCGIRMILLVAICLFVGFLLPQFALASELPSNGLQQFYGYTKNGENLNSPGNYFTVTGYVNGSASSQIDVIETYVFINDNPTADEGMPSPEAYAYIEVKASGSLKSFRLQSVDVGEFDVFMSGSHDPKLTDIVIKGYAGTTELFATDPYNSITGTLETSFPINYAIAQDKVIDSFRIYYRKLENTYHCELNLIGFTVSGVSTSPPVLSNDASLKTSSKIKGQTVASLGTPAGTADAANVGSVTLTSAQAANTTNLSPYTTLLETNDSNVSAFKVVKYATGASYASFETDTAYANGAISNGDFFIIKVVAQDGTTTNYYRITATVKSNDAGLTSVAGQSVTLGGQTGSTTGDPKLASITVANSVTQVALNDVVPSNSNATVYLFAASEYMAGVPSVSLAAGASTTLYIQIDSEDESSTLYYAVSVYRQPQMISSASVTMTAPAAGATPEDAAAVEAATHHADYTVTNIQWNGTQTSQSKFAADTAYSAIVTLQSKNSKAFQAGSFAPTVIGAAAVGTTTSTGTGTGNTVAFAVLFYPTEEKQVTSIAVTTQPSKMSYTETEDGVLNLSGMEVTETYNDGTHGIVTFTDGTADGYLTSPENGDALTTAHNGSTVTVTHTLTSKTADTGSLTVAPAPTYGISLSESSYTFPARAYGYSVSPEYTIRITNEGNAATGSLTLTLGGENPDKFQLSTVSISSILQSEFAEFIVRPLPEMEEGTYTATVTVSGSASISPVTLDVSFTVEPFYNISVDVDKDGVIFDTITVGDPVPAPETITIINDENAAATGDLTVRVVINVEDEETGEITQVDVDYFVLSKATIPSIAEDGSATFTIVPKEGLAQGEYRATVIISNANVGSREFDVEFLVMPIFSIELDPADTLVIPPAIIGYDEQTPSTITIENIGTYETFDLTVEISGTNASSFELSDTMIPSIPLSESGSFTIKPVTGLDIGTYTALIKVDGDYFDAVELPISFTVTAEPTHSIALDPYDNKHFGTLVAGYGAQAAHEVTVNSTGTGDSGALIIDLSGTNPDAFELSTTSLTAIPASGSSSFTVVPKTGLSQGYYSAVVTVSGVSVVPQQILVFFRVDHSRIIALNPDTAYVFPQAVAGYEPQTACEVTVSSTGTGETGNLTIALGGTNADAFEISKTSLLSIAALSSDSFTIVPKTGLSAGTYTASVTVSGPGVHADGMLPPNIAPKTLEVSFTVAPAFTHEISLYPAADYAFPAAAAGYGAQTPYSVAVNSTGTGSSGALTIALSGANANDFRLSKTTMADIASQSSDSFTIAPKTGLAAGTYTAAVKVSGFSVTSKTFNVNFTVNHVLGISLDPQANYDFPEAEEGYGAQSAYNVNIANTGTAATGALAIALSGTHAHAFELSKTSVTDLAVSASTSFTVVPKTGLAPDTYSSVVTISGSGVTEKSFAVTFKVTYQMSQGVLEEVIDPTTSVIVEGLLSRDARLVVTDLGTDSNESQRLGSELNQDQNAIAVYEVHVEPAEAFRPPLTLTFAVGQKYNGKVVHILHELSSGRIDIYKPTVENGQAAIVVNELSPFLLAIDPVVIIANQPHSTSAPIGTTATFTVTAEGLAPFTYRWQRRTNANAAWEDIVEAVSTSYTTTTLNKSHDGYAYRVIVTDMLGNTATSDTAILTVVKSPATGDVAHPWAYAILTGLFMAAAVILLKKRKTA